MSEMGAVLIVRLGASLVGLETMHVRELSSAPPLFQLPLQLSDISHLAMLRGEPHGVINTEYFLGIAHSPRDKVLFLIGNMAIFVDDAVQTIHDAAPDSRLDSDDESRSERFVKAVIQYRNRIVPVLNLSEVLKDVPESTIPSL